MLCGWKKSEVVIAPTLHSRHTALVVILSQQWSRKPRVEMNLEDC